MKFHDDRCKGKAVMRRKRKCGTTDGRTDRRDMVIPVYPPPPNFVAGGIKTVYEWYGFRYGKYMNGSVF